MASAGTGSLVIAALGAIALDQITKLAALLWLSPGMPVPVTPGFSLTLGFNTGASFGMLAGTMADRPWLMVVLTGALTVMFGLFALQAENRLERYGFALIVGGALGNIIDRMRQGAVTDFLNFYWREWHWPSFNMADVAITCGAALVLLAQFWPRRQVGVNHGA